MIRTGFKYRISLGTSQLPVVLKSHYRAREVPMSVAQHRQFFAGSRETLVQTYQKPIRGYFRAGFSLPRVARIAGCASLGVVALGSVLLWMKQPIPRADDESAVALKNKLEQSLTEEPYIDAQIIAQTPLISKVKCWFSLVYRLISLVVIFLPAIAAFPMFLYLNSKLHSRCKRLVLSSSSSLQVEAEKSTINGLWFVTLLTWCLQAAGPTFVKLAQYTSSREDLCTYEVCQILGKLQDRGSPHSFWHTRATIDAARLDVLHSALLSVSDRTDGRVKFDDVFMEFEQVPVGVGAIAQVYKARLRSTRKLVAVKILHPYVSRIINKDLQILASVTKILVRMFPNTLEWLSLPDEVRVFSEMMRSQTDLRREAVNLIVFRKNFQHWSASGGRGFSASEISGSVQFPTPLLASRDVLVEEFFDAVPVSRFLNVNKRGIGNGHDLVVAPLGHAARLKAMQLEKGTVFDVQIAQIGMQSFVKMLLVDNFTHADLHPGNIQVAFRKLDGFKFADDENEAQEIQDCLPNGVSTLYELNSVRDETFIQAMQNFRKRGFVPQLIYLDAGLISTLSATNLVNLNDLLVKIVQFDGHGVAKLIVERQRQRDFESGAATAVSGVTADINGSVLDFNGFSNKMSVLLTRIRDSSLKLSTVSFSWILRQVFSMVRTHHVRLEGDFANVGVAVMLVEGVGRQLDPGVDLLEEVRDVVAREWKLAAGNLFVVRAVLEVYAYSKLIGQKLIQVLKLQY
ncbi:hypothetical protein HK100_011043 [Physocladia obscura]|uniref:ABC1 atypical kinase-like domain-containing protein n=1 Tax=Physocladia obscura TaxID=109957 RepID=A0AAD5T4R9_9FUNG|nr:hypothetical protein HK100_011043 [Physocladia obscura]